MAAGPAAPLVHHLEITPSALPAVRSRDITRAWDLAQAAAREAQWGEARVFHFRRPDGGWSVLALEDRDARCWASAMERHIGLRTAHGLSLCLRLLALVELLARTPWLAKWVAWDRTGARLHPSLLRLAAEARLTDEGRFDEGQLRAGLCGRQDGIGDYMTGRLEQP